MNDLVFFSFMFIYLDSVLSCHHFAPLESYMKTFWSFLLFCTENDIHLKAKSSEESTIFGKVFLYKSVSLSCFLQKQQEFSTMIPELYIIPLFLESKFEAAFLRDSYPLRA